MRVLPQRFTIAVSAIVLLVTSAAGVWAAPTYSNARRHFSLNVPVGWGRVNDSVISQAMQMVARPGTTPQEYEAGFQPQTNLSFTYPYVLIQYIPGSVTMDEVARELPNVDLSATELSKSVNSNVARDLKVSEKPRSQMNRDKRTYQIDFAIQSPVGKIRCRTMGYVGHDGLVNVHCYARENDFYNQDAAFITMGNSLRFDPGFEYVEVVPDPLRPLKKLWPIIAILLLIGVGFGIEIFRSRRNAATAVGGRR